MVLNLNYENLIFDTTIIVKIQIILLAVPSNGIFFFFQISEKESQITKLREKLKTVLEYNRLFANENDRLKGEYTTLANYAEECKKVIREEKERNGEWEKKYKKLEEKVKHYEVPDKGMGINARVVPG